MNTYIARRPAAARCLAALAIGALALTGCAVEGEGKAAVKPSAVEPSASADTTAPPAAQEEAAAADDGKGAVEPSTVARPASADTTAATAEQDENDRASDETARWAGTEQFVQIERAWTNADRPQLSVRLAQKEPHPRFESWVITPGTGPFTTVPLAIDANVLAYVPIADERGPAEGLSPTEFVGRVMALSAAERASVGFDLTFDGTGQVVRVESLYRP
ncbi:hypothetical protein [Streptomyces sp. JJ38]|uniref:hypothetical protein n=1 Tax=Streptomyces sp. JJ38 TaxID=2738128 RepID=UPI001C5976F2|nr:hypothetical protein [Streptomyces sp. JJ38]MBW1596830.1 hypothetical protein [Streptomyces sp. JJ38]